MRVPFLLIVAFAFFVPARTARAEVHLELGPELGVLHRPAKDGDGVRYGAAFAYGARIQIPLANQVRLSTYYLRGAQNIDADSGAFGTGAPVRPDGDLISYVLGARIQPTFSPWKRLHLWLDLGVAWGIMNAPAFHVAAPSPYIIAPDGSAFTEFPFGIGGELDFPPWVGVTLDLNAGPVLGGFDLDARVQAVDASGKLVDVRLPPPFSSTFSATIGVVLRL